MTSPRLYLDYNATAPLRPEARAAMIAALDLAGNPSSVHAEGRAARAIVEAAREEVAALVGARPGEVIFTSSATEANCWAVAGRPWSAVAVGSTEHASLLAPQRRATTSRCEFACHPSGIQDIDEAVAFVRDRAGAPNSALVALGLANGETGVIQPVAELVQALEGCNALVHADAAQAVGRIGIDFHALGVGLMSLSAHKLGGPKGVGALVIRDSVALDPLIIGGGQERRRRAGTESVAAIAGFGAAAAAARQSFADWDRVRALRDTLEAELRRITPQCVIFGEKVARLPNTSLVAMPGKAAETSVIKFDLAGVAVSAGAACSSGKVGPSHVLAAMGVADELARAAVRISLGPRTSEDDIRRFVAVWTDVMGAAQMVA